MTDGSSMVDGTVYSSLSAICRIVLRRILPDRVFRKGLHDGDVAERGDRADLFPDHRDQFLAQNVVLDLRAGLETT